MTDTNYNDGKWHGWNGGDCPVHPDTIVNITYADGQVREKFCAGIWKWDEPLMFRVIKEYRKPVTKEYTGECWAYQHSAMAPSLVSFNVGGDSIKGKYTATHVDGKLKSITWIAEND
jgi:prepilin-type processing-associated H-X9-DG protein